MEKERKQVKKYNGSDDIILLDMSLKSAFLRLFIDHADIVVDNKNGSILEIHGQTRFGRSRFGRSVEIGFN